MIVVVDTNAVLGAFTEGHAHRPLLDAWLDGRLTWAVSTDILLEYEEILARRSGRERAAGEPGRDPDQGCDGPGG